jgi:hypothetical protein
LRAVKYQTCSLPCFDERSLLRVLIPMTKRSADRRGI